MKQFRDLPYWVTEEGKVFRYYPSRINKHSVTHKEKKYEYEKIVPERYKPLPGSPDRWGYWGVRLCYKGVKVKPSRHQIHRLVAELYCPGYFEGAWVDHIDNNPENNHYTNLQWCTPEYNIAKGFKTDYPLFNKHST